MATDIAGLFGLTPQGLDQQRYQQDLKQGYELAQLDPGAAARATLQSGVGQLGRGIAGMMGIEDPQMKLISARQSIIGQLDQTDPASLLKGAQMLTQMGDQQGAFALADYARKAQESLAQTKQRQAAALASEAQAGRERQQATPNDIQIANRIASLRDGITQLEAAEQTPENTRTKNILTYQLTELERISAKPEKQIAPNIKTVGVAEGPSKKAVLLDVNADQLFTYEIGADGKQYRKPYAGQVNRVTSTTNVGVKLPEQEKEEKGARGKMLVKQYEGVSDQARIAVRTLPSLESNLSILDKGFDTGFGTEVIAAGAKVLGALGVPEAERLATNAQTFLANANAAVLQRQLEQKGPQTESDAQRITTTGAQFGNTKEANRFLISVAKAQLKRDIDQRNFYDKWWKANSTYDGAEDAWFSGEGGKSLFDRPELKAYKVKESAASQIPSQSAVSANIPQAAIDALNRGVGTDAQFDAQFGAGSAKRVKGGR
jgi:hypothetical protein